jgi:hypothetical protein
MVICCWLINTFFICLNTSTKFSLGLLVLLLFFQEVMGLNLGPGNDSPVWGLLWFHLANGGMAVTTPYLQPSGFVIHNNPVICYFEASLNNPRINEMYENIV